MSTCPRQLHFLVPPSSPAVSSNNIPRILYVDSAHLKPSRSLLYSTGGACGSLCIPSRRLSGILLYAFQPQPPRFHPPSSP
jgi:hypothetical protein